MAFTPDRKLGLAECQLYIRGCNIIMIVKPVCQNTASYALTNRLDILIIAVQDGLPSAGNELFENLGDGSFQENTDSGIHLDSDNSHGNAVGDFNDDGFQDVLILNTSPTTSKLWRNNGGDRNWIKVLLEGTTSNRDGIGSRIEAYFAGEKILRTTHSSISYLSQNSFVQTIGVGTSVVVDSLVVLWPSGIRDVRRNTNPHSGQSESLRLFLRHYPVLDRALPHNLRRVGLIFPH